MDRLADAGVKVAVDIGGTFTDVALTAPDGFVHQTKLSSTPDDPSRAVVAGVASLLAELSIAPSAVSEFLHGTTVGSNALLQRSGSKTGLITTRGFRDVLEIGRIRMPDMFDLRWDKPKPLVPRRLRLEVDERVAADGSIVRVLNEQDVIAAGNAFVADGVRSVAIVFINSYRNPRHERRAEAVLNARFPDLLVTTSYAVLPEIKEYERTSTTVVNAYLLAVMQAYLQRLESGLRGIGVSAPILVMTSNGGMLSAAVIEKKPVLAVASGPAGGVVGAARLGLARGDANLVVFDMGGTTAKAVVVEDGRPTMTSEYEFRDGISTSSRFIKAGGYLLKVPAIDIAEVGAGGGSIAGTDAGGLLVVGPRSAGAVPGPACYGLGNDQPTVTDANVLLGYVNPGSLAGGRLAIDRALSERAIVDYVARPLGISAVEAAHGIRTLANAAMARAVRAVTVERGRDPRDFTLMAFGGNGGVHAPDLARQLGIRRVIVPPLSGVFCSVGMLASDIEHTALATVANRLDRMTDTELADVMAELRADVDARLRRDGYPEDRRAYTWEADIRHDGQATELPVPFDAADLNSIRERFTAEYVRTYGYRDLTPIELMKVRLAGRGLREDRLDFTRLRIAQRAAISRSGPRLVVFKRGAEALATEVVTREAVDVSFRRGPLIIEEFDATTVVPPDASVRRDEVGCLVLEFAA